MITIRKRFPLVSAISLLSTLTIADPIRDIWDFRLPGWPENQVVIPELNMLYRIGSLSDDGNVMVGARTLYFPVKQYPFYYSAQAGYREIPFPEGVELDYHQENVGWASDLTADGAVVVGNILNPDGQGEAFRYFVEEDRVELLGIFPGVEVDPVLDRISTASAISADGSVIVGQALDVDGRMMAFRWTESTGMQRIFALGTGDFTLSWALDVSPDGSRICGFTRMSDGSQKGFYQDDGGDIIELEIENGSGLFVIQGIAGDDNSVIGYGDVNRDYYVEQVGFAWDAPELVFEFPSVSPANPLALFSASHDMQVATGEALSDVSWQPYIWTAEQGPQWASEFVMSRFEISRFPDLLLRSAWISNNGSSLLMTGREGVYRFNLDEAPAPSHRVFPSSTFTGSAEERLRSSSWFGSMEVSSFPWVYHDALGWIYIDPDSSEGSVLWIWPAASGKWLSTSLKQYPAVFDQSSGSWLWHLHGSRWFFDFSSGGWIQTGG